MPEQSFIKKADWLGAAVRREQYPIEGPPEIAFAGRSNVGKSSLLNLLTNRKRLAKVSGSPGKTQTINFFAINGDAFRIVDLPGYGYARVSKSVSEKWGAMVESYLKGRGALKCVCVLVDIRHEPTAQDCQLYEYLAHYEIPALTVATKADKISVNARQKQVSMIRKTLGLAASDPVLCVSALKRTGVDALLDVIENIFMSAAGDMPQTERQK